MKSVLVISRTDALAAPLKELMQSEGYSDVSTACSTQQAKALMRERSFDVVIINTPILDGGGIDLSVELVSCSRSGVFVLMKSDVYEKCCDAVEEKGVFAMQKPLNRAVFHQCLKIWEISKNRLFSLESENLQLKHKVEEMKVINRAKCTLMQCLTMSEQQAHRYIEKQAMDMRISRFQVAQRVLSTYEL
ncbi:MULTISPECIES: ANTAR domain-containing response regulator [unclassified Ruminococcus]|uniref:ANTAR domain-containing response regulator n=1 Tax=unclassified Ruminococcus TaxID=2608920 RepID=UPI002108F1A9|nr:MULTISPECIES: ANTAR domain-containing protein [unclassified Ruminococcus]